MFSVTSALITGISIIGLPLLAGTILYFLLKYHLKRMIDKHN